MSFIPELYRCRKTRLTAALLFLGSAPIALALAWLTHLVILPLWLLMWGVAGMARRRARRWFIAAALLIGTPLIAIFLPPPGAPFFMGFIMVFAAAEQIDAQGRPGAFNLVGVVFPALCCLVLSANIFLFIALLVALVFYIGALTLRLNDMPLSGIKIRLVPILATLSGALFVALLAFILLPRIDASRVVGLAPPPDVAGLSDSLEVSGFSEIIENNEIAFRAMTGRRLGETQLYWRVFLLSEEKDGHWRRAIVPSHLRAPVTLQPSDVRYEVRHARANADWFPLLGAPALDSAPRGFFVTPAGEIAPTHARQAWPQNMTLGSSLGQPIRADFPTRYTVGGHPRLAAYAARLRAQFPDRGALVSEILRVFASEGFSYSLRPPALDDTRMDRFFFETRIGYCSHYAIATATILRAAGIAANIVVGYTGGQWNEYGNYYVIRDSDAHAWVEYEVAAGVWASVDPTSFVPQAAGGRANSVRVGAREQGRWQSIRRRADAFFMRLSHDILLYDAQARADFLRRFDGGALLSFAAFWLGATLGFALPLLALRRFLRRDILYRAQARFITRAARAGFHRDLGEGWLALARRWAAAAPPDMARHIERVGFLVSLGLFAPSAQSRARRRALGHEIFARLRTLKRGG